MMLLALFARGSKNVAIFYKQKGKHQLYSIVLEERYDKDVVHKVNKLQENIKKIDQAFRSNELNIKEPI